MLNTRLQHWFRQLTLRHPTSARRRATRRQMFLNGAPALALEVLEHRLLLTPSLTFAVEPSNGIAGHELHSLTVDVVEPVALRRTFKIDTSYTGEVFLSANGPGGFYSATVPASQFPAPGTPLTKFFVEVNKGVGKLNTANEVALELAGSYTLTATSPAGPDNPGVAGSVISKPFTIAVDKASDHLVFVNLPSNPLAGQPLSVTVAVEDQFGNLDTSVSNQGCFLQGLMATGTSTATVGGTAVITDGVATFKNVDFPISGLYSLTVFAYDGSSFVQGQTLVSVGSSDGGH